MAAASWSLTVATAGFPRWFFGRFYRAKVNILRHKPTRRRSAFARLADRPLYDRYTRSAQPYPLDG